MHDLEQGMRTLENNDLREQLIKAKEQLQDSYIMIDMLKLQPAIRSVSKLDMATQAPEPSLLNSIKILSATRIRSSPEKDPRQFPPPTDNQDQNLSNDRIKLKPILSPPLSNEISQNTYTIPNTQRDYRPVYDGKSMFNGTEHDQNRHYTKIIKDDLV
jgi:hypothetical protein